MLVTNAGDAGALDAIILPLVFTARSATVFRLPNRRAARPVASVKLGRNMLHRRVTQVLPRLFVTSFDRAHCARALSNGS
jgi:hypothetical protein